MATPANKKDENSSSLTINVTNNITSYVTNNKFHSVVIHMLLQMLIYIHIQIRNMIYSWRSKCKIRIKKIYL